MISKLLGSETPPRVRGLSSGGGRIIVVVFEGAWFEGMGEMCVGKGVTVVEADDYGIDAARVFQAR